MAHVEVAPGLPGIVGLLEGYPRSGAALRQLTEVLLRGPSPLTPAERELIAAYVSTRNACVFCSGSHTAAAQALWRRDEAHVVAQAREDPETAAIDEKLKALLAIAGKVQQDGRLVATADIERARRAGADDRAIHDTVLIAAAFCMFNRYVDGLGTWAPTEPAAYAGMGERLATDGYLAAAPAAD